MPWTRGIGHALRIILDRRIRDLSDTKKWGATAGAIQRRELRRLIQRARGTEFGRAAGFDRLLALSDEELLPAYRRAVPIHSYLDLKPMLERMRQDAQPDVTWPGVVMDWAQTSGTTSGDKFVPISRAMLRHNAKAAFDLYAHAHRFDVSLPRIFDGKILFLGGSTDLVGNEHGVRTGDLSGVVTRLIRWPMTDVWLPGKRIALEPDWPTKIDLMARCCLREDVRWISGMPSWSIVLFDRMVELAREEGRAISNLREVWPNLEVFVHGGVKYGPFERRIRAMWSGDPSGDDIPTRLEVYAASEAFVASQDRRGDPGLRLNIDHKVFYEFVPIDESDRPDARAFSCDEVEPGERYVVIMSTCGGLWRYNIGDVVQFDTIPPDGPPRLRIVGRSRLFMNAFGENIIAEHIENAVTSAAAGIESRPSESGAPLAHGLECSRPGGELARQASRPTWRFGEFTAAPIYPDRDRPASIELLIEWDGPTDHATLTRFAEHFDASIKSQNNDYAAKRSGGVGMALPVVTPVPTGTFHRWLESIGKLGGQHKCPRCANDRSFIDAVLNEAQTPPRR